MVFNDGYQWISGFDSEQIPEADLSSELNFSDFTDLCGKFTPQAKSTVSFLFLLFEHQG